MARLPWARIILILVVVLGSVLILLTKDIKYGLDLRGGAQLLLKVHADEAVEKYVDDAYSAVKDAFEEKEIRITADSFISFNKREGVEYTELRDYRGDPPYFEFVLSKASDVGEARTIAGERIGGDWSIGVNDSTRLRFNLNSAAIEGIRATTVKSVQRSIEQRINTLGVSEPTIVAEGNPAVTQRILLQLPDVEDLSEAEKRIRTPGRLEYRMSVHDVNGQAVSAITQEEILAMFNGQLAADVEMVPEYNISKEVELAEKQREAQKPASERKEVIRNITRWYLIEKKSHVDSKDLVNAEARYYQEEGKRGINFTLNPDGGERLRNLSRDNIGRYMAIVLDDEVIVHAVIESELGTEARVTGDYTEQSSQELALLLRTGAIPTSMSVEERRHVGPALGADSIRMGFNAFFLGMIAVAVFMLIYYKLSGMLAVVVLSLNIVFILAIMAALQAVLTLPGIAGIILTIGMAVDANVIIFERIREERRIGRSVVGSVDSGFGKAFQTIFDANITTLIAALFLFQFGTGPIKGFATTITIGILASMFTAIFIARTAYDSLFALKKNKITKLSI